jgi:hypothetical protein
MLSILGIVAIVVMTIQVYKTAKNNERNAGLWAVMTALVGIGLQFVLPIIVGIVIAIVYVAQGTRDPAAIQQQLYGPALVIGIVSLVLSIIGMVIIFKFVSRVPDAPPVSVPPPPPDKF